MSDLSPRTDLETIRAIPIANWTTRDDLPFIHSRLGALVDGASLLALCDELEAARTRITELETWAATDQDAIDAVCDGENVIIMRETIYALVQERDDARSALVTCKENLSAIVDAWEQARFASQPGGRWLVSDAHMQLVASALRRAENI